jgi:hypothetical protein
MEHFTTNGKHVHSVERAKEKLNLLTGEPLNGNGSSVTPPKPVAAKKRPQGRKKRQYARPLGKEAVRTTEAPKPGRGSLSEWLRESREFITEVFGPQAGCVTVSITDAAGNIVTYTAPDDHPGAITPKLSELEQDIICVIGRSALPPETVASRLGRSNHAYIRTILAQISIWLLSDVILCAARACAGKRRRAGQGLSSLPSPGTELL